MKPRFRTPIRPTILLKGIAFLMLAAGPLLGAGCGPTATPAAPDPKGTLAALRATRALVPEPTETPKPRLSLSWEPYEDARLAFDLPVGGSVEPLTEGLGQQVLGPKVPPHFLGYVDSEGEQPAFLLTITRHPNPEGLSPEAWGRRKVLDALATVTAEGGPNGGLPVDESGAISEDKVATTSIGGRPAFRVSYFKFDSHETVIHVADGQEIVTFAHPVNIEGNVPIAEDQIAAFDHILGSLRWMEAR